MQLGFNFFLVFVIALLVGACVGLIFYQMGVNDGFNAALNAFEIWLNGPDDEGREDETN